jgi:DNA-binding XRE family transcriptional regulator
MQEMTLGPAQCRMARAAIRWSVDDLAAHASVGRATIIRFENGDEIKPSTRQKLRGAFEAQGVRFTGDAVAPPAGIPIWGSSRHST